MVTVKNIAKLIDQSLLKPEATEQEIRELCEEADRYGFAAIFVNPVWVPLAIRLLKSSPVLVGTVVGFPLGASTSTVKAFETRDAVSKGADEIDMVMNIGAFKSGDHRLVRADIEAVVEAASGRIVKVILETSMLSDQDKVKAALLAKEAGAYFVKTSTGFGPGGATVEDVALLRKTVGANMGVKASGGIRDLKAALAMIEAGATRIGTSSGVAIVKAARSGTG